MSSFAATIAGSVERYIDLQHSLGYQFDTQAGLLHAFVRYVRSCDSQGPLTQALVLDFIHSVGGAADGRAKRYGFVRRFAQYHAAFDARTESLDPRALPRSRATPPPRILSEGELRALMQSCARISKGHALRGITIATLIGLLASTGLRSGEALRLDRGDVDLTTGVLHIRRSKFRKDRLVPVHATTLTALRRYAQQRDRAFPVPKDAAFFINSRRRRLCSGGFCYGLAQACTLASLNAHAVKSLRPHDLRHRFAVTRLAAWHRQKADVQALLPLLATYLGHARYSDTAYYITATPELLGLASKRAFGKAGVS
jgi:integrase